MELVEVFERILRDASAQVQYHFVLVDYLCRIVSGEPRAGSDVSELRLTKPGELESLKVSPETCAVIRKAVSLELI